MENVSDTFDCCVYKDEAVDIFAPTAVSSLVHIRLQGDQKHTEVLLESKTQNSKIKNIRCISINSAVHLFYILDYSRRLLVHQIIADGKVCAQPEVVDTIGKKGIYDAVKDADGNIHIVYLKGDNTLNYRVYQNTLKGYDAPREIMTAEISDINITAYKDSIYASYICKEKNAKAVCVMDIISGKAQKISALLNNRASCSLYVRDDIISVEWEENSLAFRAQLDLSFKISKISSLGKSTGIHKVINHTMLNRCAFNLKGEPFCTDIIYFEQEKAEFREKGYEAKQLSMQYMNVLEAKRQQIKEDFLMESLARIEASLSNLVNLVQKSLSECDKKEDNEYNEEKQSDT